MNLTRSVSTAPNRHFARRAFWSTLVLGLATACSAATPESADETTSASTATGTLIDGSVESFKSVPSLPSVVYVLRNDGALWREAGSPTTRTSVAAGVHDYQPIDGNVVYVLGTDGSLWREAASPPGRTLVASSVSAFSVTTDGTALVYYLDGNHDLWAIEGSAPAKLLVSGVAAFQYAPHTAASNGTWGPALYVLLEGGALWRANALYNPKDAALIDSNIKAFVALDGLTYYAETTDSNLWRVAGPTRAGGSVRGLVDSSVALFAPLDTQTVFVAGTDGKLWREQFTSHQRDLVVKGARAFQPVGPGQDSVYVLGTDGNLRLESLAAPACSYSYAPRVCSLAAQNDTFVAAWGVETANGDCPAIQAASGVWTEMTGGKVPSDTSTTTPTCAGLGLKSNCCLYVWTSSAGALQDPSVLCTSNNHQVVAFDECGVTDPLGGIPSGSPGGPGCIPCMGGILSE
jgi:hypothetical protein